MMSRAPEVGVEETPLPMRDFAQGARVLVAASAGHDTRWNAHPGWRLAVVKEAAR